MISDGTNKPVARYGLAVRVNIVTLRVTLPRHAVTGEPRHRDEGAQVVGDAGLWVAPFGWEPNPVISGEAAAMCATDYKSSPRRGSRMRGSVMRMLRNGGDRRGTYLNTG